MPNDLPGPVTTETVVRTEPAREPCPRRRRLVGILITVVILLAIGGVFFFQHHSKPPSTGKAAGGSPPLMISTATAQKGSIGVYVSALGLVTPVNTVAV